MPTTPQTDNATWLRTRFAETILREHPRSILDVGCGRGELLQTLRSHGIHATGHDPDPARRDDLRAANLELLRDDDLGAPHLRPAKDHSFDWVTMRHVVHHLANPSAMLAEAFRVCRAGVILAEPWFDRRVPSQANAEDLDEWLKREHRRRDRVHEPNLGIEQLLELVPHTEILDPEWSYVLRLRLRPIEDITQEAQRYLPNEGASPARDDFEALLARARLTGLTCNGSLILTLRRRTTSQRLDPQS